jgi:hypothetical protein
MRSLLALASVLLLSACAAAQATIISGYASNWPPAYGWYAAPFVPLVSTPSATLGSGFQAQVGASNATAGNVAGATNATISLASPTVVEPQGAAAMVGQAQPSSPETTSSQTEVAERRSNPQARFEFGVASFQSDYGVAQMEAAARPKQTARVYTNQDLEQLNQNNGEVRYGGKRERIE